MVFNNAVCTVCVLRCSSTMEKASIYTGFGQFWNYLPGNYLYIWDLPRIQWPQMWQWLLLLLVLVFPLDTCHLTCLTHVSKITDQKGYPCKAYKYLIHSPLHQAGVWSAQINGKDHLEYSKSGSDVYNLMLKLTSYILPPASRGPECRTWQETWMWGHVWIAA